MVATTENRIIQFGHATVQYTNDFSQAAKRNTPKLYVQAHDQYGYQREWSLGLTHKYDPMTMKTSVEWESHIYMHPGRRQIVTLGASQAKRCIGKFLYLCDTYPDLLFNGEEMKGTYVGLTPRFRPRHEGFVRFAERMHRGETPSANML